LQRVDIRDEEKEEQEYLNRLLVWYDYSDEDYKSEKDQRTVGTKKERVAWLKRKDEDPKSEEDEPSSLDVKDRLEDELEVGDDGKTLTSPPEEGKERSYASPSAYRVDNITIPCSLVRPPTYDSGIGIPRIDFDSSFATAPRYSHPETDAITHSTAPTASAPGPELIGEKEKGATDPTPMRLTLRCPTAKGFACPLMVHSSASAPAANIDITLEERMKSHRTTGTVALPFMTPMAPSYDCLTASDKSRMPTMCDIASTAAALDTIVEGEEEDVADWIIKRWTKRGKEGKRWTCQALCRIPESVPFEFTMDFVGPVICLPGGRPPRFIMTS
jgi:hypothetical protein